MRRASSTAVGLALAGALLAMALPALAASAGGGGAAGAGGGGAARAPEARPLSAGQRQSAARLRRDTRVQRQGERRQATAARRTWRASRRLLRSLHHDRALREVLAASGGQIILASTERTELREKRWEQARIALRGDGVLLQRLSGDGWHHEVYVRSAPARTRRGGSSLDGGRLDPGAWTHVTPASLREALTEGLRELHRATAPAPPP